MAKKIKTEIDLLKEEILTLKILIADMHTRYGLKHKLLLQIMEKGKEVVYTQKNAN